MPSPEHLKGLWLLADLAGTVPTLDSPAVLYENVLEHAVQMFRCQSGAVCVCDGESGRIRLVSSSGDLHNLRLEDIVAAEPVRTVVLGERRPLVLPDPGATLGTSLGVWHGLAVIPLANADGVMAFVLVGDLLEGDAFTEADTILMLALGNVAASALDTRLSLGRFRQDLGRKMTEMVAELSHAAAELQRLKTFTDEVFDSTPVGIVVFDREFRVTFRNAAADNLWPDDRSVPASARRTDIIRRDPDWESGLRDVVNMRQPWMAEEVTFERPGHEPVRVNLTCSPLFNNKRAVIGGVLVVEDVTQRIHMERRLAVSERLAGVGRLAAMVAHEINNPLDGVLRLVNLARRIGAETGDERIEKYLSEAHKGLMRMGTIVRDLLDFSRTAGGNVDPMPLREILTEASQNLAAAAEKAGVAVAIECDQNLPPLRSGILYQVMLNLIKNAIEACPQGGRVDVRARCGEGSLVLDVADSGPGIPAEALGRLFQPFFTLKAGGKGTGLGLVISKDLVEKQGGTITAGNRPGGGAVFTVRVPLASAGK